MKQVYTLYAAILVCLLSFGNINTADAQTGLQFNGSTQYVTTGVTPSTSPLNTPTFTVETWFRRDGTGGSVSTGTGGITAIPLVTKGTSEGETANADVNYFLGINTTGNVLCADFEEAQTGGTPGLNHPISGTTAIVNGQWYHAAATYNGTRWQLFLDGNLEAELSVGQPPNAAVLSPFAMATSIRSNGTTIQGYLNGVLDEVRLWNYARSQGQIQADLNNEITSGIGLLGRWSLNEGAGTLATNSIDGNPNGTLRNVPLWVTGAPFNITITPPAAPGGCTATAPNTYQVNLSWIDNSNNETSFEVERSTTGVSGTYSLIATLGAGITAYNDVSVSPSAEYCYRVRAINISGPSGYSNASCVSTPMENSNALDFTPNTYVNFGDPAALRLSTFTIETWFRRDGAGTSSSTGSSGVTDIIPLVSKGGSGNDNSPYNLNYALGISAATSVICADFEEAAGSNTGLNHPVVGVTSITTGTWYHAAVTYDGSSWKLYLNGILETETAVGATPSFEGISPVSLATMIFNNGTTLSPMGYFAGAMDEVRIWNVARTAEEILLTINSQLTSFQTGLVARWGLNEAAGTTVNGSAGTTINGTVTGTGYSWTAGAPFDLSFVAPDAPPINLIVTPVSNSVLQLSWTDNSTNESGFEIERSTSGPEGPFILQGTVAANVVTFNSTGLTPLTTYCYRVRAVRGALKSAYTSPACGTTLNNVNNAIDFGGTNAYVQVANNTAIQLPQFTIETWFRREGIGVLTTTGTNGITNAVPLIAKGCQQAESPNNVNMNYFLGIDDDLDVICGDFEEPTGPNHPIRGTTVIQNNVWYHVAFTFDGADLRVYLNGNLETTVTPSPAVTCASENISALGLGTSIQTGGTAYGFFDGVLDEARIWNVARSQSEIQSNINIQLSSPVGGLVARWGLNEGIGTAVSSTAGITLNGTITGSNYQWVGGAPFNLNNLPPIIPTINAPLNGATGVLTTPTLDVTVSDPDGGNLTVNFYGRPAVAAAAKFSVIVLPDAQNYTSSKSGGLPATFTSQTQWCVNNQTARNIKYVSMVGDITDDNSTTAWGNANTSMSLLDATPPGIPYGIALGNHDYTGGPSLYSNYFPTSRFTGRFYYGGAYDANNENHYELFESDGMRFIVINLSSGDQNPTTAVLEWADALLKSNSNRHGIIINHSVVNTGNPASFTGPGQVIYDALKDNPNLFLMLGGHVAGEGRRSDTDNGNTVYSLLADYQSEANGGNGWLRIMEFDPPNNQIHVTTYSPTLNQWKTTSTSQFDLSYVMQSNTFQLIGTNSGVTSGANTTMAWPALLPSTQYQWYVTVSDGTQTVTSPTWSFTTAIGWTGSTNSDWNTVANWSGGAVPTSLTDVTIPDLTNDPVISSTTQANCRNLNIASGASLTIKSNASASGSLIATGTITGTGTVTYERLMTTGTAWHYVSSPVSSSSPAGSFYGWNETTGSWDMSPINTASDPLVSGKGYTLVATEPAGTVSFTGSVVTSASQIGTAPYNSEAQHYNNERGTWGGGGWNLLGNPFTSAMNASLFLSTNTTSLDPSYRAVYIYNGSDYYYIASGIQGYTGLGTFPTYTDIQAGQGFFVLANYNNVPFNFTPLMRIHNAITPMTKSAKVEDNPWPGLQLKLKYGDKENSTLVVYNEKMSSGLDPGYDVGQLSTNPDVEIYTSLVEKDNNVNFARQALPLTDCDKNIIPIGIDSEKGGEVTFSAYTVPLENYRFWLEDRTTGIFTNLNTSTYTVTLPGNVYGTGRFFIIASTNMPTGIKPPQAEDTDIRIWTSNDKVIIKGGVSEKARCEVYDVNGSKILDIRLTGGDLNTIDLPEGSRGVLLVRVVDRAKVTTRKVVVL